MSERGVETGTRRGGRVPWVILAIAVVAVGGLGAVAARAFFVRFPDDHGKAGMVEWAGAETAEQWACVIATIEGAPKAVPDAGRGFALVPVEPEAAWETRRNVFGVRTRLGTFDYEMMERSFKPRGGSLGATVSLLGDLEACAALFPSTLDGRDAGAEGPGQS